MTGQAPRITRLAGCVTTTTTPLRGAVVAVTRLAARAQIITRLLGAQPAVPADVLR